MSTFYRPQAANASIVDAINEQQQVHIGTFTRTRGWLVEYIFNLWNKTCLNVGSRLPCFILCNKRHHVVIHTRHANLIPSPNTYILLKPKNMEVCYGRTNKLCFFLLNLLNTAKYYNVAA